MSGVAKVGFRGRGIFILKETIWGFLLILLIFFERGGVYAQTVEEEIGKKERPWHYTLSASMIKSGPGIGAGISYSIEKRRRVELDMTYGVGTNKGRNFVISIETINLTYDLIRSKRASWYITGGIGIAFLELQEVSINVSRENAFAYGIGIGWRYYLWEKLSFTFDPSRGWINPIVERVTFIFDVRSIGTTSDLPFTGGATFGRLSIGLNMGI